VIGLVAHAAAHSPISFWQSIVLGLLQGITELFPVSSLGHTVLFPSLFGWHSVVMAQSDPESFWLAFVVMLHVGSAVGILVYFWRDFWELAVAWFGTLARRRIQTPLERLAWLIVLSSIPAGVLGLLLEHTLRVALAKPTIAACFLMVNGLILISAERLRRRAKSRSLDELTPKDAVLVGFAQSTALIAGISRDGVCMSSGLARGLTHESSARYAFLLATPIILAAGAFKVSDLTGPLGDGVRMQALVAALCAAVAAYFSVRYLVHYFKNRTLTPFGIYCLAFGAAMVIYTTAG
jgi:undecaprenyl-diphosphatase